MARRGPTHPGWENPPRLESFPRLRSRDDRRANQPLFVAAVFVAAIMVALVAYPFVFGSNHGSTTVGSTAPVGSGAGQSPIASSSQGTGASASPRVSFLTYTVRKNDYMAKIAVLYNLSLYELQAANPSVPADGHIEVGQVLNIPPAGYFTPAPASANPSAS